MATVIVGIGYTGRRLLERLPQDAGKLGFSRTPGNGALSFDLDRNDTLPAALPEAYSLVYTVPPARTNPDLPDPRLERLLPLLSPPPSRFVYLSTTGVYGNHDGRVVTEDTPVNPMSDRARRRVAAERLLTAWCGQNRVDLVILRVPGIYGPGRLGIERISQGTPVLDEASANPGNRIHVDDLASACIAALSTKTPAGIYNLGDGDERSSTWFANEVARQLALPPPPTVSRKQAEATFSPTRLSFLSESRRVDTSRMREVLGITPRYEDATQGIRASLAEERRPDRDQPPSRGSDPDSPSTRT